MARQKRFEDMDDLFGWVASPAPPKQTRARCTAKQASLVPKTQSPAVSMPPPAPTPAPAAVLDEISLSNRRAAMEAIVTARHEQRLTLLDVAWDSGVSWDAVRSWAKGRREPTMGNLIAVAQTLGFDIILRKKSSGNNKKA